MAGQEVMHVHFHIIPKTEQDGLGVQWASKQGDVPKIAEEAKAAAERYTE